MLVSNNINPNYKDLRLGLFGRKLSHSFSKVYFEERYGIPKYKLIELPTIDKLHEYIATLRLDGFNVTIPYKCDIIPMLDEIDPAAREIGAVNTVVVKHLTASHSSSCIRLTGYNTDAPAFLQTLRPLLQPHHRRAVILGNGGASKAVAWALQQLKIDYRIASRSAHKNIDNHSIVSYNKARLLVENEDFDIIINATPVGMFPNVDSSPWQWPELIGCRHLCYDLIYNPSPTLFLKNAAYHGATIADGLAMLHRQADLALQIWATPIQ